MASAARCDSRAPRFCTELGGRSATPKICLNTREIEMPPAAANAFRAVQDAAALQERIVEMQAKALKSDPHTTYDFQASKKHIIT
eukprot:3045528-Amphidinium_carterae.1